MLRLLRDAHAELARPVPTRPLSSARAAAGPKGVPEFWLTALTNGKRTGATITEADEAALKFLTDVTLEYLEDFTVRARRRERRALPRPPRPRCSRAPHCSAAAAAHDALQGFRLEFAFSANPFFTNEKLTKTFHIPHMMGGGRLGSDPSIEKLVGCEIAWCAGKNLTVTEVKKQGKKKGKKTTVVKMEPTESFFRL